jgi:NADPH:quinone reductase-like Zn-dependent oxidoreductase
LSNHKHGAAGSVGSGIISAVAAGDGDFSKGDAVIVIGEGTWGDDVTVSKDSVVKSSGLSHEEGAALPTYAAAWGLLHNFTDLKSGDLVVQTTGTGAVGSAVTQLGKALGLKVVSLADSDVKGTNLGAKLQEAGAYKLAISGQSGKHISSLQRHGAKGAVTVAYHGAHEPIHSSSDVHLPISHMIFNDSSVRGFDLLTWSRTNSAEFKHAVESVVKLAQEKKISLKPAQVFPQSDYLKAIEEVMKTGSTVVLKH